MATIVQLDMHRDAPLFQINYREGGHLANVAKAAAAVEDGGDTTECEEDEADPEEQYAELLKRELIVLCRERGLRVEGRKAELIERLVQFDEAVGDVPW